LNTALDIKFLYICMLLQSLKRHEWFIVSPTYYHILSRRILQLQFPNVTKEETGQYQCYLNQTSIGVDDLRIGEQSHVVIGSKYLIFF